MLRRFLSLSLLLAAAAPFAGAQQTYAQKVQTVRAGVVLLDSAKTALVPHARSAAPHVWFNLNADRLIKPAGWTFVNPNAPGRVDDAMAARWASINGAVAGIPGPAVGTAITKRQAGYWEVNLSTLTDAGLASYDILLVNPLGYASLNSTEREKLRRFVDQGGVLWIDPATTTFDQVNTFPLPFRTFNSGGGAPQSYFAHPLLSGVQALNNRDLALLNGASSLALAPIDLSIDGAADLSAYFYSLAADFFQLQPVSLVGSGTTVAVGRIGDGFVVVTARGASLKLNRVRQSGASYDVNGLFTALEPELEADGRAAAKLAINMISLTGEYRQSGGGSRKSNSSNVDVVAPLIKRFASNLPLTPGNRNFYPPAMFKGLTIVATNNQLIAYDAQPNTDLDGDGDPDDGFRDFSLGADEDVVWASTTMASPISAPTCVEVPDTGSQPVDQVLVVDGNGTLRSFAALPKVAGKLQGSTNMAPNYTVSPPTGPAVFNGSADGSGPFAVTVHEGLAYIADTQRPSGTYTGRIWIADTRTGSAVTSTSGWAITGGPSTNTPEFTSGPTVGYVPIQDNSGGADKVLYVPYRGTGSGTANTSGFVSYWLGVRGERPTAFEVNGGVLQVTTRASLQGGLPVYLPTGPSSLGVKLTLLKANGDPLTGSEMSALLTGAPSQSSGGVLNFPVRAGVTDASFKAAVSGVRLDYTIDWGTGDAGVSQSIERGRLNFPDQSGNRRVLNNIAMSPRGTIYLVLSSQTASSGGSFYALREEGRGSFRALYRWDLYPSHQITLNQAAPYSYSEVLPDSDGITNFAPGFLGGTFGRLTFQSGPSVRNGLVYVTVGGVKGSGFIAVPTSAVLAFTAEPANAEIRVEDLGSNFTVVQPDFAKSADATRPDQFSVLQASNFIYEKETGQEYATIRFDSVMGTNRGPVQNALSTSQPVIIRRPGQPDLIVEPEARGSNWNPLQWYVVFHGVQVNGPPMITGGTMYVAGASGSPAILNNLPNPPIPPPTVGVLVGMNSDISSGDAFLKSNPARPWLRQVYQIEFTSPTNIRPNPAIRWPQTLGVTSFEDYIVRLNQTTMPGATTAYGVVAGDGAVVSWSDRGVFGFSRADYLVADEGRLARFDSSGNALWVSNSATNAGTTEVGFAQTVKPLVRPTKAYRLGENDMLVVDSGANRVVRMSTFGQETRSISTFRLDANFVPDGYKPSADLDLKNPRDVVTFTEYRDAASNPFASPQPLEYWVHYVIADTGNQRLVEIVDRYAADPANFTVGGLVTLAGVPQDSVLLWHTPANVSGRRFDYNSINRVFEPSNGGRFVYVAGIGSATPTRVDLGLDAPAANPVGGRTAEDGTGGIVIFDPNNPAGVEVIREIELPALSANIFWDESSNSFTSPAVVSRTKRLTNLNSVTSKIISNGLGGSLIAIMITDGTGVYEVVRTTAGAPWQVRWMITNQAYRALRRDNTGTSLLSSNPGDLRATFARRLDSGEVLIVNGYLGRTRGAKQLDGTFPASTRREFQGEVIQLDGDLDPAGNNALPGYSPLKVNLGFRSPSIRFELSAASGTRGLVLPVFADRQ